MKKLITPALRLLLRSTKFQPRPFIPAPRLSLLAAGFFGCLLFSIGCNNNPPDNVQEAKKENAQQTDSLQKTQSVTDSTSVTSKQDADYMVTAASGGMMEVELGKLAQTNASRQGLKDFGNMMVRDHSKGGEELKSLAMVKRVILPDSLSNDQKKEKDKLQKKTGRDFDKSYTDIMVKDHKETIDLFEKAGKNANDPDIKAFFNNHLTLLHAHLDSIQNLQGSQKR